MHFFRAAIVSISTLAFLVSASSAGSSASCASVECGSDADCGGGCHCVPDIRVVVSSSLLPSRSNLTCYQFTEFGALLQEIVDLNGVMALSLKWSEDKAESRR